MGVKMCYNSSGMLKRIVIALGANLAALALVLANFYYRKPDARVFIYSFIMVCMLRYLLIELFYDLYRWIPSEGIRSTLVTIVKPFPSDKYEDKAAGFHFVFAYVILIILLFFIPFILMHLEGGQFIFSWAVFGSQLKAAFIITMVYGLKDLLCKGLFMDFSKAKGLNFYYNSIYLLVIWALGFFGGWLISYSEKMGTSWLLVWILLASKTLMDFIIDVVYTFK